ncbi:MAG TPA: hypothetical protein VFJ77_01640 [Gaiellaceae bacterium]|nr:hypothetical protein [Gaiellaceae bacterium]
MPTRKQRRRAAKEKRHEYETVWVDAEGNELEEPPEEAAAAPRPEKKDARAQTAQKGRPPARGARTPPPPSWQRAGRRALLLGVVVFVLFYAGGRGGSRVVSALGLAALYTALFVPFTYAIDRFAYNRWQRRQQSASTAKTPRKKR